MKKIRKVASMSLVLLMCSPIAISYADQADVTVEEKIEQSKEEQNSVIKLTLSQALEKAIENNSEIKKIELELEKAEVDYKEGKYDIRANKKLVDDEKETSLNYLQMVTLLEFTNEFSLESAKRKEKIIKEKIKSEVEELYFNLVQSQELRDVNRANIDLAKRLYDIAQIKLELGLGVNQEVLNSKLNYTKSKESYDQSVKNLENAKMLFNTKLGLDNLQKIELVDKLEYKEFDIENMLNEEEDKEDSDKEAVENSEVIVKVKTIDEVIKKALESRNEIKLAEFNYELEKLNMLITKKRYPSITFMYRQQEAKLEKAEESLESTKTNIETEVRSSYKELNQKRQELDSAKETVDLAKEGFRVASATYNVGMGTLLDVETSKNSLDQAELGLSNAILQYNLEVMNFKTVAGLGRIVGGM